MPPTADIDALCHRLGIPGVVDAHCHFMPEAVLRKVWRWFDEGAPYPWPIQYREDESTRRAALEALGVTRYTSLNYAHKPGMAAWLNDWTLGLLDRDPRVIGTGTFFPEPEAPRYLDRLLADGRIRGFKLHLQVGGFHPDDPRLHPGYARLQEAGLPVVIHCGTAPVAGPHTAAGEMDALLAHFPDLKVIVAHMGAYEYGHYLRLAEQRPSVFLDTTMIFVPFLPGPPFPEALLPRLEALGDKVLFGSDFPNIPYPYGAAVQGLVDLGFGDGWLRGVLHDNALRVFGVDDLPA